MEEQETRLFEEEQLSRRWKPPSLVEREEPGRRSKKLSPLDEVGPSRVVEDELASEAGSSKCPTELFRAAAGRVERRRSLAVGLVEEELLRRLLVDGCCSRLSRLDPRLVPWSEQHLGGEIWESV